MFLKKLRNLNYQATYEWCLAILAAVLVFRKPGTLLIVAFILGNLCFYKKLSFKRDKWWPVLLIAIPFLLDLFFLWNNDPWTDGFKHMEKRLSTLLFPLFIIGQTFVIDLKKVLRIYTVAFTAILFILFLRFLWIEPELMTKYLSGIDLWEMGYSFANSTTVHAPALNMHVAFLVVASAYLCIKYGIERINRRFFIQLVITITSLFLLLFINTRLAIANAFFGVFVVLFLELVKKVSRKKLVSISLGVLLTFMLVGGAFAKAFPFIIDKYTKVTFAHMDMVGRLDELENPEAQVYSSFVTRVSIWKTAWERAQKDLWIGVGAADGKDELNQAYVDTNQKFLAKYKFPTHNQFLDFLLKFGIAGLIGVLLYVMHVLWLSLQTKNALIFFFFVLFFTSNLTDDFLIRYDGITFSALWISVFAVIAMNARLNKVRLDS